MFSDLFLCFVLHNFNFVFLLIDLFVNFVVFTFTLIVLSIFQMISIRTLVQLHLVQILLDFVSILLNKKSSDLPLQVA